MWPRVYWIWSGAAHSCAAACVMPHLMRSEAAAQFSAVFAWPHVLSTVGRRLRAAVQPSPTYFQLASLAWRPGAFLVFSPFVGGLRRRPTGHPSSHSSSAKAHETRFRAVSVQAQHARAVDQSPHNPGQKRWIVLTNFALRWASRSDPILQNNGCAAIYRLNCTNHRDLAGAPEDTRWSCSCRTPYPRRFSSAPQGGRIPCQSPTAKG